MMKRSLSLLASILMLAPIMLLTWLLWVAGLPWWVGTVGGLMWAVAIFALGTAQPRTS